MNKIVEPEIMFNKNVVDFELYAGLFIGYLIAFLEEFSRLVCKRVNFPKVCRNSRLHYPGIPLVHNWLERLLS